MNLLKRLALFALLSAAAAANVHAADNTLTAAEKKSGWTLLFDGRTTAGWRLYGSTNGPGPGWQVTDGVLKKIHEGKGGDIVTVKQFDNFEFAWDWRVEPGGNNGIKYLVTEKRKNAPGPEYQMLDDEKHPDGKIGPKRQTASFYDVLPPAANKPSKPGGEWNNSRVLIQGSHVEHWLNGAKVLEYELGSDAVKAAVAKSKFKNAEGFGTKISGHMMLTDHHDEASFKNMKLRELKAK